MIHSASKFLDLHFYSTLANHFQGHTEFLLISPETAQPWTLKIPVCHSLTTCILSWAYSIFYLLFDYSLLFFSCQPSLNSVVYHLKQHLWNPYPFLISNLTQNQCYKFTFFIPTPRWLNTNRAKSWVIHHRDPCFWEIWVGLIPTPFSRCRTWIRLSQSGYFYLLTTVIGSGISIWLAQSNQSE